MISLIVCSRAEELTPELIRNIDETIGVSYELVTVDNSRGEYDIFTAYNHGVEQAHGDLLCFMHEDILFHTDNWGQVVYEFFKDTRLGLLGVVGGIVQPKNSDWRVWGQYTRGNCLQRVYTLERNPRSQPRTKLDKLLVEWKKKEHFRSTEVATVDGLWFCVRAELFRNIRFDDTTFKGFHMYDLDICMQIGMSGMKVAVAHGICIEHFSDGSYSEEYREALITFNRKWECELPRIIGLTLSANEMAELDAEGWKRIEQRIERDVLKLSVMKKLARQRKGIPEVLTKEEDEYARRSVFRYMRHLIKSNSRRAYVFQSVWDYCKDRKNPKRLAVFGKFLYYKIIRPMFKKHSMHNL